VGGGFGGLQAALGPRGAPVDLTLVDRRNFHGQILLLEAADRVLTGFPPSLSRRAAASLRRLGVTPMVDAMVVGVDGEERHGLRRRRRAPHTSRTVVWAAGVAASSLAEKLSSLTGAERDRNGRVTVEPDLTLATTTRATWRRSAAPRGSPTSRASTSAASSPGRRGWSSTSGTRSASRTGCWSSSAGPSAPSPEAEARG
jgi:hypothetical protein